LLTTLWAWLLEACDLACGVRKIAETNRQRGHPHARGAPARTGRAAASGVGRGVRARDGLPALERMDGVTRSSSARRQSLVEQEGAPLQEKKRKRPKRECKWDGCRKWDVGGGYCVSHGGGRRCEFVGCMKSAPGKSPFCAGHGGKRGKGCAEEGCEKGALKGGYCKSHGGGRRCEFEDCTKSAMGKSLLCIAHGGQRKKRCTEEGCEKGALKGGYCVSHGGGRRCEFEDCTKSARGKSLLCVAHGGGQPKKRVCGERDCQKWAQKGGYCISHGGGRRCRFGGFMKSAKGKSSLCVAHGGNRGKRCGEEGCEKRALKGGYCVSHGGGRRCEFEGCMKSASGKSSLCVAHGGNRGKRCGEEGCEKRALKGGYCVSHGGGRRCEFEGCMKSAQGKSSLCKAHGGDRPKKRVCGERGCEKWALKGGYCVSHGGGRRCEFEDCMKSAIGKSLLCIAHGGQRKKRCTEEGCEKGALKGGYCVSHGGGRRCEFEDCMKSASGRSSLCVAHGGGQPKKRVCGERGCQKWAQKGGYCISHGGGRRCEFEDCMKSASGKSSLCVAHGGDPGKRCAENGCEKRAKKGGYCVSHGGGRRCEKKDCMKSATGKSSLCIAHGGDRGKRCGEEGCEKGAAKGGFCISHGGGRRCEFEGCMKSASGKSLLCVAHGGQRKKRCAEQGCEKGAKKGGYCKSHGGGRRC
ncbi:Probable WRKY transcription factor 19 (WRKY DNA-binding protein 19), partial [Durusdinium trenchii]